MRVSPGSSRDRPAMRLAAALLAVALLGACSGEDKVTGQPTGAPTSASPTPSASAVPSPTATTQPEVAMRVVPVEEGTSQIESFQSPSHNVRCSMGLEADGTGFIRCDIAEHSWTLPAPQEPCEDGDWGSVATVSTERGEATMGACVSDAAGGDEVLQYGHGIRLGELDCRSATTGMTCRIWSTSHGFVLSKAAYRLF